MHEHFRHPTHEEIALAAYYLWASEGRPWGDNVLTYDNWMCAQSTLEFKEWQRTKESNPGHDTEAVEY